MEPSKEPIAVRIARLNRLILGKVTTGSCKFSKRTVDREALLDALTVLYDDCNEDPIKKSDELVRAFLDRYRSTLAELRRSRVCISDFDTIQIIGRGYFGDVHMVREKQTGDVYALKTLRKEAQKRAAGAVEDERDVLATAVGPWVPKLQYAFQDMGHLYLVMELCGGGDLAGLLSRRNHPLSERDAAFYIAEVTHALKALHALGYVHRDVKPHNILLDRCGHVKLGDFGSCARLSEGGCSAVPVGTPDYVAPELLAAAECASRHTVCLEYCRGIVSTAISACDYWSLGVVAFELVTLKRPFSTGDEDTFAQILSNIQKYERDPEAEPPFDPLPCGPSASWRSLVAGLLRVNQSRRYNYLDTLQHPALAHLSLHAIRDQPPPWVPCLRGAEDASHFSPPPRSPPPPSSAPFRTRPPFAGQLPFIGYSYVAPEENDETSSFSSSHDSTAIDLATFKSAEKLAATRAREIASLQTKLAAAEASAGAAVERTRREADAEAERQRARLQAEITALTLQNKRLERQVEVEKEERMALQRTNQELACGAASRHSAELRAAQTQASELQAERDTLKEEIKRLESRVEELQRECAKALTESDAARVQHKHYKDILEHVHELRHRRITEMNVRAVDTIAKERALRRQTLSGGEAESREAGAKLAAAEANAARESRARELAEKRLVSLEAENTSLQAEISDVTRKLTAFQESLSEKKRIEAASNNQVKELQMQLTQERVKGSTLQAQVQELQREIEEATRRETALEEQCVRTEARLNERLEAAEARATSALQDDARHRQKVQKLEQLVRQLEREVSALETRECAGCDSRSGGGDGGNAGVGGSRDTHSDTESVGDVTHAQITLLKEQLERAEAQLQARAEEMATLRQEARSSNLARWRKEREFNDLSLEAKATSRDLKRLEERLSNAIEARKTAEKKALGLQTEIDTLRPQYEQASKEMEKMKTELESLRKRYETAQAEVDRSRNDIRKLKSELQYSEKRRLHAEEQEELSSRERGQLRDELMELRERNSELTQNNKALQEACSLLEEQLNDLEKLADIHEVKNKGLETELHRMRTELTNCKQQLSEAEKTVTDRSSAYNLVSKQHDEAVDQSRHAHCQLSLLRERLESREVRVSELECRVATLEGERSAAEAALGSAARRVRDLQEECAALRTRAHDHHAHALSLQAQLTEAQEEVLESRETAEAAAAWWRTRETKADATLRQQAKLIDFLQAKVEEAGRKKCSLSNRLFGRSSSRRGAASPPLRRANRELREEVERLRAKLAAMRGSNGDFDYPPTPRKERKEHLNSVKSIDTPDARSDTRDTLQIVWGKERYEVIARISDAAGDFSAAESAQQRLADGSRERMRVREIDGKLLLSDGNKEIRARLQSTNAPSLPQNEANRAFTIKVEGSEKGSEAGVVCSEVSERAQWVSRLAPPPPPVGYTPPTLTTLRAAPYAALHLANNVIAIGSSDGLHSLRGTVQLEWSGDTQRPTGLRDVTSMAVASGRAVMLCGDVVVQAGLAALGSAMRRASTLQPTVPVGKVRLPDISSPRLVKGISTETTDGPSVAIACGRRLFLLRFDAAVTEFKVARSLTLDRYPNSLLLTGRTLYIAGERLLKVNLPSGTLETFGLEEPIIAAAAKKQSPPRAILLIKEHPIELLICYAECGVFINEHGRRTRNDDPKWSSAVTNWEFINPFLYAAGDDKITIYHINEESFKSPPCTCDTASLASTPSDCYMPAVYDFKANEPVMLGQAPNGVIIRSKTEDSYSVSILEGMTAFRSVGASVESLESMSDKWSSTEFAQSVTDVRQDISEESVELTTGFLADIRRRARQLRKKNGKEKTADDVIKEILSTEVSLKRMSGRKSPETASEFDSDSESETRTEVTKSTGDICAEMFARQVRFQ